MAAVAVEACALLAESSEDEPRPSANSFLLWASLRSLESVRSSPSLEHDFIRTRLLIKTVPLASLTFDSKLMCSKLICSQNLGYYSGTGKGVILNVDLVPQGTP